MERGITLLFLCSVMMCSQVSGHLFKTLLAEMQDCILDQQISPVSNSNEDLRILLAAVQDKSSFDKVMACTALELQKYTNSQDVEKRFLAERFSSEYGDGSKAEMWYRSVPASGWTCLIPTVFNNCLNGSQFQGRLRNSNNCSSILADDPCPKSLTETGCQQNVINTVMMFLNMSFGKCLSESQAITTARYILSTETSQSGPFMDFEDFLMCSHCFAGNDTPALHFMFPPSELSRTSYLQNNSDLMFKQSLQTFCSKIEEYARNIESKMTANTRLFFNSGNFENALRKYCANQELITSQTQCTLRSLKQDTCNGGTLDIVKSVFQKLRTPSPFGYNCSDIKQQLTCRIEKQLKPCNEQYANVMYDVTSSLLTSECRQGGLVIEDNPMTNILPCGAVYNEDVRNMGQSLNNDTDFIAVYLAAAQTICKKTDEYFECMEGKIEHSTKPVDRMIKETITVKNIRTINDNMCHMLPSIAANIYCLKIKFEEFFSMRDNCVTNLTNTIGSSAFDSFSTKPFDPKIAANLMSSMVKEYGKCLSPIVASCDAELGKQYGFLVEDFSKSFSDNSYVVPDRQTQDDQNNSVTTLVPTLATLLGSLLVTLHF